MEAGTEAREQIEASKTRNTERNKQILFGHLSGDNTTILAERHDLDRRQINRILQRQGVCKSEDIAKRRNQALDLLAQGMAVASVSKELGYAKVTVRRIRLDLADGWTPRSLECKICNTVFTQSSSSQLYCCDECSVKGHKITIGNFKVGFAWKNCELCDTRFRTTGKLKYNRRFCSKCVWLNQGKKNLVRNQEILYLRHTQELSFGRIGNIFDLHTTTTQEIYYKELKKLKARTSATS